MRRVAFSFTAAPDFTRVLNSQVLRGAAPAGAPVDRHERRAAQNHRRSRIAASDRQVRRAGRRTDRERVRPARSR